MTRRRPAHRLTSALIGAIVAAMGTLTIALLSGRDLDTELIAIIALAAIGGWLLVTALLAGRRPRSARWAEQSEASPYAGSVASTSAPVIDDEDEADAAPTVAVATADDAPQPPAQVASAAPLTAAARKAAARTKAPTHTPKPYEGD